MKLNSPYGLNQTLTPAQFEELRASGDINPNFTWEDYLGLHRERAERRRQAEEEAARLGYELKSPEPPDWTEEDDRIMREVRHEIRAEMARERDETQLAA